MYPAQIDRVDKRLFSIFPVKNSNFGRDYNVVYLWGVPPI